MSVPTTDELRSRLGPWTEADFLALAPDHGRTELLDGGLLVNPGPGSRHQRLSFRLCSALESDRPGGMEVLEAVNVRLVPGQILIPDLVVTCRPGVDVAVFDARDVLAVVEIVSPGSVAADRAVKPRLYAAAGIATYVRVELAGGEPAAFTYRLADQGYALVADHPGDRVLHLVEPFAAEVDLAALLGRER